MTPVETVIAYTEQVWNRGEAEAITELCGDPCVRHEAGTSVSLSHADQLDRVHRARDAMASADGRNVQFINVLTTGDGTDVCAVWNMTAPSDCAFASHEELPFETVNDEIHMCGTEIFRVVDGRITEVWNPPPMAGHWG